jgi:hypothetical protein
MSHREPHAATEPQQGAVMGMRGCELAAECRSDRPGHGLHPMQQRLAAATPSKWLDAIVLGVDEAGFATLATLDGELRRVWHHDGFGGALAPGDPVALHGVYGVVADGAAQFSVADA